MRLGQIGSVLAELGIKVAYTPLGIVVAMIFTSIPFVVRTVQPVLEEFPTMKKKGMTLAPRIARYSGGSFCRHCGQH